MYRVKFFNEAVRNEAITMFWDEQCIEAYSDCELGFSDDAYAVLEKKYNPGDMEVLSYEPRAVRPLHPRTSPRLG